MPHALHFPAAPHFSDVFGRVRLSLLVIYIDLHCFRWISVDFSSPTDVEPLEARAKQLVAGAIVAPVLRSLWGLKASEVGADQRQSVGTHSSPQDWQALHPTLLSYSYAIE